MKRLALSLVISAALGSIGYAQTWATAMFETTEHDFGTVARGAKTQFAFVIENRYVEDVHIAGVRSSCGCTTPEIQTATLKTHEKGAILAKFNSHLFLGAKGATLTVTLDKPFPAEVQLHVHGFIRGDVAVTPGSVEFGSVAQGSSTARQVHVSYLGPSDFRILEVKSPNAHLSGKAVETSRAAGQVEYELLVEVDSKLPAGYLDDHLVLVTNDAQSPTIPVAVKGVVESGITVSPASLFLGAVQPGQKVTRQVAIKADKPFQIVSIRSESQGFQCAAPVDEKAERFHLIPVTFVAGDHPGQVRGTIRIETELGSPEVAAFAVVTP